MTQSATADLTLFVYGTGAGYKSIPALEDRPSADLTDESNRLLFLRSPEQFFSLYAQGTTLVNAHRARGFLAPALAYLTTHREGKLTAAGRFSPQAIAQAQARAQESGMSLTVTTLPEPRLFQAQVSKTRLVGFVPCSGFADELQALGACLAPGFGVRGAEHWTNLWKTDVLVPALEAGVRKRDAFFAAAREMARQTGAGVNYSAIGRELGIPGVTVREWMALLRELCVVDVIEALNCKPARRTLDRPKLIWRHPGFGLWLTGQMIRPSRALCRAFFENAVALALTDAYPSARLRHFADTNAVTCPLLLDRGGLLQAFYIVENEAERDTALRHHKSILRTGKVAAEAALIDFVSLASPARVSYEPTAAATAQAVRDSH